VNIANYDTPPRKSGNLIGNQHTDIPPRKSGNLIGNQRIPLGTDGSVKSGEQKIIEI